MEVDASTPFFKNSIVTQLKKSSSPLHRYPKKFFVKQFIGAGFSLSPNGQYCLWTLGLKKKLDPLLHSMEDMTFYDRNFQVGNIMLPSTIENFQVGNIMLVSSHSPLGFLP